jgi:hypothetical protein
MEKGCTFASAIGNSGSAERWSAGNGSGALYIAADGKPERTEGVARAPAAQKGRGWIAAKGERKKVGQPLGSFRKRPTFAARK